MDIGDQTRDKRNTEDRQNEDDAEKNTTTLETSVTSILFPDIEELDDRWQNMSLERIQEITACLCWERVGAIARREQTAATNWVDSSRAETDVHSTLRYLTPVAASQSFEALAYGVPYLVFEK